jgi:hypothetical protein
MYYEKRSVDTEDMCNIFGFSAFRRESLGKQLFGTLGKRCEDNVMMESRL